MRACIVILFLLTLSLTSYTQCIEKEKITYGGDWGFANFIHRCPTYNFAFGGDTSQKWNVLSDPIDINQAPKMVLEVKQRVEQGIRDFAGDLFFSKVKFNSVEVVYPDKLQAFKDSGRQDVTLKYCKAKYFFYYEFQPDTVATYHIGIAVDKEGNVISKFNFPSKQDYQPVDEKFTYCSLLEKARQVQPHITPIKDLRLDFDPKSKRFYWMVTQDIVDKKQGINYFNQVMIDAVDLTKTKTVRGSVSVIID